MSEPPALADSVVPFRLGGHVALDFVNTVDSRTRPATRDYLVSFEQLVRWTQQAGLVDRAGADRLLGLPPEAGQPAYREAIQFRERLERIFGSVTDGTPVAEEGMASFNALLNEARARQHLARSGDAFEWRFAGDLDARSPALLIALAAADLLEHHDLSRVKRCPAPDGCGWLFLDESRNRSRKWCSMDFCGSLAKARRFAAAHRKATG